MTTVNSEFARIERRMECSMCNAKFISILKSMGFDTQCTSCQLKQYQTLYTELFNKCYMTPKPKKIQPILSDDKAVYMVTFTTPSDETKDYFDKVVSKLLKAKSFKLCAHYGVLELTQSGRLHLHIILCYNLVRYKGNLNFPGKSYYKNINNGNIIDKRRINDSENLENVINYLSKDPQGTYGDLESLRSFFN